MSEMAPEEGGGGGFMAQRWFGLPAPLVIIGLAVVAYFLYSRYSGGGAGGSSSAGSGDTLTTGNTTVDTGAVQVTVNAGDTTNGAGPPPKKTSTVTVPGVIGHQAPQARRILDRRGLTPEGIKTGKVTAESPKPGSKVKKGTHITLSGSETK